MQQDSRLLQLLARTARKDEPAFAELYKLTSAHLNAVALRILKSEAAAQDALQDAYIQIWHRSVDYHSSKGAPMTWMSSIVRYRALDLLRKRKTKVPIEVIDEEQLESMLGPLANMLETDMAQLLWQCLQELNKNQQNSVLLAFYEGLTHDELSERLQSPLGTVKSWVRRGLKSIQGCLER